MRSKKKKMLVDNPAEFLKLIPRTLQENLEFRLNLQELLTPDKSFQKVFLEMCKIKPEIAFDALFWTFNPKKPVGYRNHPFILRKKQRVAVNTLKTCIDNGENAGINKSRDEGATELACKLFGLYWLLEPESMFLVGSRKEEYVDRGTDIIPGRVTGDHKCLFHKVLYTIAHLPAWATPNFRKTYMHFENMDNGAVIDGESTNENFGAGDRRTAILLDEFGRVDHAIAGNIRDTVNDITDCVIYSSTHFYGAGHPFNKILRNKAVHVITLPWYENPEKNYGLYTSPDLNKIEILDIDYYRKICPEVFDKIEPKTSFKYSSFEKELLTMPEETQSKLKDISFIADGCEDIPGDLRSPWHDKQEILRTARDLAQNIWMSPSGASDMYFDAVVNDRIRNKFMISPTVKGEIKYTLDINGRVQNVKFTPDSGKNRLSWWGKLVAGRPQQDHNYIVGIDISLGTGASNSVAAIIDVNTMSQVGMWVCPDTTVDTFADTVAALHLWIGGVTKPYVIWENNGGHGTNFGRRLVQFHRVSPIYTMTVEDTKTRTRRNKWGWNSNTQRKDDLLTTLKIALRQSLRTDKEHKYIIIKDEHTINELDDYIWYESGEIGASELADQKSGARARHGDRIIAIALCLLGMKEQRKASHQEKIKIRPGSMAWRLREYRNKRRQNDETNPWLM